MYSNFMAVLLFLEISIIQYIPLFIVSTLVNPQRAKCIGKSWMWFGRPHVFYLLVYGTADLLFGDFRNKKMKRFLW
jgi:hypothetical protein